MNAQATARAALAASIAALALACPSRPDRRAPSIALADCQLSSRSGNGRTQARCGTLQVPEDRADPEGKKIDLRVAVISARGVPDRVPVFFLAGGPGQAATEMTGSVMPVLNPLLRDRDVVLVDQRGTGVLSTLRCDLPVELTFPDALGDLERDALLDGCVKQLKGDPRHYTTLDFVRDLDDVRGALGYSQVHLVGISYGTRAALAYMRAFPDRVRTAVLDGVAPLPMNVGELSELTAQRAMDLDLRRCADTPACAAQFPDLPAALERVLDRLQRSPELVKVRHPTTGLPVEVKLTRTRFALTAFTFSYSPEFAGLLPLLIHGADAGGDLAPAAAQSFIALNGLGAIYEPLHLSVVCAEDVPFYGKSRPEAAWLPRRSYLGDDQRSSMQQICARWPHAVVDRSFKEPVTSSVPVLLLSGEADPVTPPRMAEEAKQTLSRGLHLEVKGHSHNVSLRGCLPSLIAQVQRSSSVEGLNQGCVADIAPLSMFLDFLGHEP